MSTNTFQKAYQEYRFLREHGYPEKATLKLVGDRHRLERVERNALFRGAIAEPIAAARRAKIIDPRHCAGAGLGIDWYNVLITVESYLKGLLLFLCDDGMVRDSSALHGSYRPGPVTGRAIEAIVNAVRSTAPFRIDAFLDAPLAWSGAMAQEVRESLAALPCPCEVTLAHSADYPLKRYDGVVATSDSAILDAATRIIDLPRHALEHAYGYSPPPLSQWLPSSP
jgi:hypothetical protein